jgi:hypothetical protein
MFKVIDGKIMDFDKKITVSQYDVLDAASEIAPLLKQENGAVFTVLNILAKHLYKK